MKRLILFLLVLNSVFAGAQIPPSEGPDFYGTRHFISLDVADTLSLSMPGDTIFVHSTDSVFVDKLLQSSVGAIDHGSLTGLDDSADHPWALEWNDTISTIATRYWSTGQFEQKFVKNTAFNKNFGTTAGTVAEGNDSRILNGQTAYLWGDHSLQGYATETWVGTNYLGINAKAADANLLDGLDSGQFLRSDVDDIATGKLKFTNDFTARGHVFLYAFEGEGNSGTAYLQARDNSGTSNIDLQLRTQNAGNLVNVMKLTSGGRVGIGIAMPTEKLDVNGNILASGEVTADNINTTVQSLSGTTVTWNASSGHHAKITLSGNTTITMSNLVAGTTGNLTVTNASTAYTITFSGYTFYISPALNASGDTITMSGASEKDVLSWYYDGTQVFINGTLSYE